MRISADTEKFEALCRECSDKWRAVDAIGTYNEKRLHMIFKRFFCSEPECYEIKVGNYVADILNCGRITEIQTGHLYPLREKLGFYLEQTEYAITVVYPVIESKRIVRIERDTGEVIRSRRSPKRVGYGEIMTELYKIAEFIGNKRLEIVIPHIAVEEHRYSDERHRYRRAGKFDSEVFPQKLLEYERFCGVEEYAFLLDGTPESFTAKEYGVITGLKGRGLYSTLNLLCSLGLLTRRKGDARAYEYSKTNKKENYVKHRADWILNRLCVFLLFLI